MMFSTLLVCILSIVHFNHQIFIQPAVINTNDIQNETFIENVTIHEDTTIAEVIDVAHEETDKSISLFDDVVELNIGGQKITTLRSTLTVIPNSKLAQMFNKDTTKKKNLPMDKSGAVFFDYNPLYFNFLLDQLRAIKRMPKKPGYQIQFQAPYMNSQMNFTHMLVDLGLTQNYFLSPTEGTHINLTVNSLAGWKECYRSTYNIPFDFSVIKKSCNGSRLLVGCRNINNKNVLTLAGIGQYEDVVHPCLPKQCKTNGKSKKKNKKLTCSSSYQCITQGKRGVGWYNANNQTWGFVRGSLSFVIDPCDPSDLDSDYRLCWTKQSDIKKGTGDRCGSTKNLQNSNKYERLVYYIA
ncbi:unnamed protein product [Adineta steineri]|uniref:Potassium channel tetramerisation-type BTB domain-containing protein n=1 Tax=Adineta steineri TaxID=433720 RepID=A0A815NL54_9BILA|nr:unnamed protein product [Adineta steineri]CAF1439736.1 unnamed protein product [Adineta steineri]CAF3920447.1 unnamed protein product [Adineta steineri]